MGGRYLDEFHEKENTTKALTETHQNSVKSALNILNKSDVAELKALNSPPNPVLLVCQATFKLMGINEGRISDWNQIQNYLSDINLINTMLNFELDHPIITTELLEDVKTTMTVKEIDKNIKVLSKCASVFWLFAKFIYQYHMEYKGVLTESQEKRRNIGNHLKKDTSYKEEQTTSGSCAIVEALKNAKAEQNGE